MSNDMAKPVLEVRDLVKTFIVDGGPMQAVDHVTFHIASSEFVALVGPSGSGKTTLLSMLAALLSPTSGQVLLEGNELSTMTERQRVKLRRARIGFTFQSNNLISYLTAQENVEIMLRLNGLKAGNGRLRPAELLSRLGLGDHLHFLPAQLSGGQQQRVAIARALIHDPAIVLADEPTAALDTERAFQVVEKFASLIHEKNGAGIMVTHDLRMCRFVDRVLQMRDGRLVAEYTNPREIAALAAGSGRLPAQASRPGTSAD
jgi:putative ABC transport system ATP-binding protein